MTNQEIANALSVYGEPVPTDVRSLFGDPECLGYTGTPCPKCGRYRLEAYKGGGERCEKCEWCPQLNRYVPDDEFFPQEEDWHFS